MFSFLNSAVLFAAAATLIPLILHLFSRRRVRIIEFSSLKHLRAMQKRQVRRLKIRQLLLLLLRMLIILAVVLAFARPTTEGGNIGSHASVSAVILFDNSASMNRYVADGRLFDLAVKRTHELLDTFSEEDEIILLPLDRQNQQARQDQFMSAAAVMQQLDRVKAGHGRSNLDGMLHSAARALDASTNLNKEIYIISDRQQTALPREKVLMGTHANIYYIDLPLEEPDNCGITSVDLGGQLIMPGHDFEISAVIKNYSGRDRDDLIASLFLGDSRMAQITVEVGAGQEATVRFTRSVSRTGFHSGYIELSDDMLGEDNRFYFSFTIPDRFNLLLIADDNAGRLIELALSPGSAVSQYWSIKRVAPDKLPGISLADYDVIFWSGISSTVAAYLERFKQFVRSGGAALINYSPQSDIRLMNEQLLSLTGASFDRPARLDFSRAGYYSLETIDVDHPIFSVFAFKDGKPPGIRFYTLPMVHATGQAQVLARFSGDRPALLENKFGKGRVLTLTGPIGPEYSDLGGHAFFVPFISRLAEYLAADLSSFDMVIYTGDPVTRSLTMSAAVRTPIDLFAPDSSHSRLAPDEGADALTLRVGHVDIPGIYRAEYVGQEIDRFAVNVDPLECDLAAADPDQFATALGVEQPHLIEPNVSLASVISELRFGKELWQLFMWIAAALILAEMLLARSSVADDQS